jgi:hypothetical protein
MRRSASKRLSAELAAELERQSRLVGAPIDDAGIDRILEAVDLSGIPGILIPGLEASAVDMRTIAAIKRGRWGGSVRSMLSFLATMSRRRKLDTVRARRRIARIKALLSSDVMTLLRGDPAHHAALALAELALERVRENTEEARRWTKERIAGEYLPNQYLMFKQPKMTRSNPLTGSGEVVRFIRAVMGEVGISYSEESIIRAMQAAKKPKRYR